VNTVNEPILRKESATRPVYSLTPFTLLDYPHHSACIIWFAGCNMRCLYCYNPEIVLGKGSKSFADCLAFLQTRKGLLDAVVLSGGECLMHKDIVSFAAAIKAMGFLVKVDTNGSRPKILKQLIAENIIDFVALDFKAMPASFEKITQSRLFVPFQQSLQFLIANTIAFEVRTTIHSELISDDELRAMVLFLDSEKYLGNYYIQHFRNDTSTISALPYSIRSSAEPKQLSTNRVKVVFRN